MNPNRLQSELFEIQGILYFILSFAILHWGGSAIHWLGWIVLVLGIVSMIGSSMRAGKARREDEKE